MRRARRIWASDPQPESPNSRTRRVSRVPASGAVRNVHGPDRIERLSQAERGALRLDRRDVRDQRVARRGADTFADAVDEAREQHEPDGVRQREQRLGRGREAVTGDDERFPLAEHV